jgi:prevent-host-death family protein
MGLGHESVLCESSHMPIRAVSATDLRRNMSELLDLAATGETIVIERHGRPVAELVPCRGSGAALLGRLEGRAIQVCSDEQLVASIPACLDSATGRW